MNPSHSWRGAPLQTCLTGNRQPHVIVVDVIIVAGARCRQVAAPVVDARVDSESSA